jgi:DNA-binding MarR family transcriptional regulator
MHLEFIKSLLDLAAVYEQELGRTESLDVADFTHWLVLRSGQMTAKEIVPLAASTVNGHIAMYLSFMARYAQFYSKRVFKNSHIYSEDDWGVMATLYPDKKMKKTEVLRLCIMEKSSGNEVLKRLLKCGQLEEKPNPSDARSKLITLTDEGRTAFEAIYPGIVKLSNIVVADMDDKEKEVFLRTLIKLHHFHKPVFENMSEEKLEQMLSVQ